MIYERRGFGGYGQARERERRGADVPREGEAPGDAIPRDVAVQAGYLQAAQLIASSVLAAMQTGLGVPPDQAVRMANSQINPAQRFYEVEFHQAATILGQGYPAVQVNAWLQHLGNYMGYRKVVMPICGYQEIVDPVTRGCVAEVRIPEVPAEIPKEKIPEIEEEKAFEVPLWAWGVGAGLAVLVLMGMGGRR